jgi:hypothetical protein
MRLVNIREAIIARIKAQIKVAGASTSRIN